jgi:hypothetical protein
MNYTPEQISSIVLKVLKEIETPNVSSLSREEKIKLARNPNTPPEVLKVLANDVYSRVRYEVAQNPNTPQETLKVLATDEYSSVRWGVARNPNTSPETLKVLATDEYSSVRCEVAQNPNYKKKTLELTSTQYEALKKLVESGQDDLWMW